MFANRVGMFHGVDLWMGAYPPYREGSRLHDYGFRVLVLCAKEFQPPLKRPTIEFPGMRVYSIPLDDDPESSAREFQETVLRARDGAACVFRRVVRTREPTLVTCMAGRNRSGLVTALLIRMLTKNRVEGREAVHLIRLARGASALSNQQFSSFLEALP